MYRSRKQKPSSTATSCQTSVCGQGHSGPMAAFGNFYFDVMTAYEVDIVVGIADWAVTDCMTVFLYFS